MLQVVWLKMKTILCWLVTVGNSYSFNTTTTSKCSFSFYYRIIIQGDKTHPLIFIVGTNNFIEYLQRYQILIFIYYKFYFIIFINTVSTENISYM